MTKIPWVLLGILFFSLSAISVSAQNSGDASDEQLISPLPAQPTASSGESGVPVTPLPTPVVIVDPSLSSQQGGAQTVLEGETSTKERVVLYPSEVPHQSLHNPSPLVHIAPTHTSVSSSHVRTRSFLAPIPPDGIVDTYETSLLFSLFASSTQEGWYQTNHLSPLLTRTLLLSASSLFIVGILLIHMDLLTKWIHAFSHISLRKNRYSYLL